MGPTNQERRIHKVYVTRNTEYHVRRNVCVGVRDRQSGDWLRAHLALQNELSGSLRFHAQGGVVPSLDAPDLGESLLFHANGRDLVTSAIISIERPRREIVATYAH